MAILEIKGPLTTEMMDILQQFGNATAEFHSDEVSQLMAQHPGMTEACAMDVSYLRTRSRHTPELEARLIAEHKAGNKINISDWPPEPESHACLLCAANIEHGNCSSS